MTATIIHSQDPSRRAIAFCDSEYGHLVDVLLCPVGVSHDDRVVEPFQNRILARRQWNDLKHALETEGVTCHLLPIDPAQPYQTYTRDSCVVTPWGLLLTSMKLHERRGEIQVVETYAKAKDLAIWRKLDQASLEGGDVCLLRPGLAMVGYNDVRTTKAAAGRLCEWFAEKGWHSRLIRYPGSFRHLDMAFGVLDDRTAVYCRAAFSEDDVGWIRSLDFDLITIPDRERGTLACNVLSLGRSSVLCDRSNPETNAKIRDAGFRVVEVDISEFIADSGGVHCLVQSLRRISPSN
jgi:N-dimethylarginine dimethylaminohydrolase